MFTTINAMQLPARHGMLYLAFEIELNYAEAGRPFKVTFELVDADGGKLLGGESPQILVPGQFKIGQRPKFPQVIGLAGLPFNRAGAYSFNIFIDGKLEGQAEFEVALAPPAGGPAEIGGLPQ